MSITLSSLEESLDINITNKQIKCFTSFTDVDLFFLSESSLYGDYSKI